SRLSLPRPTSTTRRVSTARFPGSRPTVICRVAQPPTGFALANRKGAWARARLLLGRIGYAHFALLARTAATVGERFDETKLLRKAQRLSVARFKNECMHARHAADRDGYVDEEKQGMEARSLTVSTADDGCVLLNCILDKVGGAAGQTALEPLAR